jgi:hypothetical protein
LLLIDKILLFFEVSCNVFINIGVVDDEIFNLFDNEFSCCYYRLCKMLFEIICIFDNNGFLLVELLQFLKYTTILYLNRFIIRLA